MEIENLKEKVIAIITNYRIQVRSRLVRSRRADDCDSPRRAYVVCVYSKACALGAARCSRRTAWSCYGGK
jgi:hypothetical protein